MRRGELGISGSKRGFSLIELLVVISVVALLVTLLLAGISSAISGAREAASTRAAEALATGIDQFKLEFGFLPPLVHDGEVMEDGGFVPAGAPAISNDWPVVDNDAPLTGRRLIVWNEGVDDRVLRRRSGSGADQVELPGGGTWDDDDAWDDRRYSKFSLSYFLGGIGGRSLDGVDGPGMARPQSDGFFVGVGYPAGSTRDRYDPVVEGDRDSLRLVVGYAEELEFEEHGLAAPSAGSLEPEDSNAAYVDSWGRAFRYYRWEPGRISAGRRVIESTLDLNLPAVLVDPVSYAALQNDDSAVDTTDDSGKVIDFSGGSPEIRGARYAVVSAGPDGLFGTERITVLASRLRQPDPTDLDEAAQIRRLAWEDNIVVVGN